MKDEINTARSLRSADADRQNGADAEDGRAGGGATRNPALREAGCDRAPAPAARAGTGIRVLKVRCVSAFETLLMGIRAKVRVNPHQRLFV